MKKKPTRREINRRVDATLAKLHDRPIKKEGQDQDVPAPKSGSRSFEKPASEVAVGYQPHRSKGAAFRDTRGDAVIVQESGALANLTKREIRARRPARKSAGKPKKETVKKSPSGSA